MKVIIKIRKGARGRYWWRLVADSGTVAVGPAPGHPTIAAAHAQATSVLNAELDGPVQVQHKRHWWEFWWRIE